MFKKIIIAVILILILIQFIPLEKTNPKVDETIALNSDIEVMKILKRSCYDCHSYETKWSIYSDIAPLSFSVSSHVSKGRKTLNYSEWSKIDIETKKTRLKRAIKTVKNDMMPLSSYLMFHEEAKLSQDDKKILVEWFEKELSLISPNKEYF